MRDEKFLNNCLMDSDVEAKTRTTRRRQRAAVIALSVEAALVMGLALWPIVTAGSAPTEIVMLPRIPYHGSDAPKPETAQQRTQSPRLRQIEVAFLQPPPRVPARIDRSTSTATENIAPPALPDSGPGRRY